MAYVKFNRAADSSLYVCESLRRHKDKVQERFEAEWERRRPGTPAPRVDEVMEFMADDLDEATSTMMSSLDDHLIETASDGVPREERTDSVGEARGAYQYIRDHSVATYGKEEALAMGFDLATEKHPWRLARQMGRVLRVFRARDPEEVIQPRDETRRPTAVTAGHVVSVLAGPHERLTQVLSALVTEVKDAQTTYIRKEETHEEYAKKFTRYAGAGEALLRMAGLDEEADRVKPSLRRPGLRAAADPERGDEGDSAPADPNAPPAADDSDAAPALQA